MQVINDVPLKEKLWYRIGGVAKFFITCSSREDILDAFDFIEKNKIEKIFIVGEGTNLLFADEYFHGVVLQIKSSRHPELVSGSNEKIPDQVRNDIKLSKEGDIEVFAGVKMEDLINFSLNNNFVGFEWAGGLPGTVGGAVRGNAGAYGGEIKDSLLSAEILDYSGGKPVIRTLTNSDLNFSYRNSLIKQNGKMIVISAKFKLQKASSEVLKKAIDTRDRNTQNRKDKHPLEYPNTGSVFINPREEREIEKILSIYPDISESVEKKWYGKVAVASLIDRWGLKGFRVGDAQISEKHALFIVNLGAAKAEDVLAVIETVRKKFFETLGFELKIEVEIVN
jgi:UDP-N-acetylmuramate dehydrogenase